MSEFLEMYKTAKIHSRREGNLSNSISSKEIEFLGKSSHKDNAGSKCLHC